MADRLCTDCGGSLPREARSCARCGERVQGNHRKATAEAEIPVASEPRDPDIRAEDYGRRPPRPSWWRWVFMGGS